MPIKTIEFDSAFQITLDWVAGIRWMIVYSRPAGAGPLDEMTLLDAMEHKRLKALCSGYEYGPETKRFSYAPEGMQAQWIEIFCCDIGVDGAVQANACAGRFFNGSCKVSYEVRRVPVAEGMEAVRLVVRNNSSFDLKPGGIGYAVGNRLHRIPLGFQRGEEKVLPQFEVSSGATISIKPVEDGYPVRATLRETGRARRGE